VRRVEAGRGGTYPSSLVVDPALLRLTSERCAPEAYAGVVPEVDADNPDALRVRVGERPEDPDLALGAGHARQTEGDDSGEGDAEGKLDVFGSSTWLGLPPVQSSGAP
jgi:hypothetical protein